MQGRGGDRAPGTVSVRPLRLTNGSARSTADGGAHRTPDDSAGDGAGGGLLFDGLATGRYGKGGGGYGEGGGETFHDGYPTECSDRNVAVAGRVPPCDIKVFMEEFVRRMTT